MGYNEDIQGDIASGVIKNGWENYRSSWDHKKASHVALPEATSA